MKKSPRQDGQSPTSDRLAVHVIHQAARDLDLTPTSADEEQSVYEARLFWLKDDGGWKASRDTWLTLAGFDPQNATAAIRKKLAANGVTLDEPFRLRERKPPFVFDMEERRALRDLPKGEAFHISEFPGLTHKRLGRLMDKGAVTPITGGFFIVPRDLKIEQRELAAPA